jgi:orotidine-5'-phosphate decarboxylase
LRADSLQAHLTGNHEADIITYEVKPEMSFTDKLSQAIAKNHSLLCIGLDPDPNLMPPGWEIYEFNRAIIEATADLVCAYKPNLAFYEAHGAAGLAALQKTLAAVPRDIPFIGDAKRGDIGHTAEAYARALFETLGCDAATVNPYMGGDSVAPFLKYKDRGVFILCRTSNPGAADFQSLSCQMEDGHFTPLFEMVARKAREWNLAGNVGLVVGATYPDELKKLRQGFPELPFLIPGVGAQGGEVELAIRYGNGLQGRAIINSSRQVLYASRGADFATAARAAALKLRNQINSYLT